MSVLEAAAKPFLQKLMDGERVILTADQQLVVAQWIVLKVIVSEHQWPNPPVVTAEMRRRFYDDRSIPEWTTIVL